jgi:hypothetical protein
MVGLRSELTDSVAAAVPHTKVKDGVKGFIVPPVTGLAMLIAKNPDAKEIVFHFTGDARNDLRKSGGKERKERRKERARRIQLIVSFLVLDFFSSIVSIESICDVICVQVTRT